MSHDASRRAYAGLRLLVLAVAAPAASQSTQTPVAQDTAPITAPYRELDRVEGDWIQLNTVPVRPMALTLDGLSLYAVDNHASTLVRYNAHTLQKVATYDVPWGPVSVATWVDPALATATSPAGREIALVVCQASHVVVAIDPQNGRTRKLAALPAEPADILVDHVQDRAFVSCTGADAVAVLRLPPFTVNRVYSQGTDPAFRVKHPQFLSFDAAGRVLVAPLLSGNDTTSSRIAPEPVGRQAGELVLDLNDPKYVPDPATGSLPDEDLFAIDPADDAVEVAATGLGTLLFAHAVHPTTGKLWLLNTEAVNADADKQSEAALRGIFVENRLTVAALVPGTVVGPELIVDLDDVDPAPGVQYDPALSVGQPCSLAFDSTGAAFVTGLLTDNVTVLDSSGSRVREWDLAEGAIPRAVLLGADEEELFVYCWGNNTIEVWDTDPAAAPIAVLALGVDPAPAAVRDGRVHFYDGANSLHGNASCASCHVEGRSDLIVWNLSDVPSDDKGPLLTQTLAGIGKLAPFHWRGERPGLLDFNPAFDGLLGGTALDESPGGDFEEFEAFVLSIQNPANPGQDRRRVLNDNIQPPELPPGVTSASAIDGQDVFFDELTFAAFTCNDCHALPTGSGNDHVVDDTVLDRPRRAAFKVPPFHELWRREQTRVGIEIFVDPDDHSLGSFLDSRAFLGAGLTHAGVVETVFDFVGEGFNVDEQQHADLVSFLHQIDQGLGPAVHAAFLLNATTVTTAAANIQGFLMPQALIGNCDIGVYGVSRSGQNALALRWFWDRDDGLFHADLSSIPPRTIDAFLSAANLESNVFLGLPVGMSKGFAVDYDRDELVNRDETQVHATDPYDGDSDDDGFPDGHEIAHGSDPNDEQSLPVDQVFPAIENPRLTWITTRVARIQWETDEPAVWRVEYATSQGGTRCLPDPDDCLRTTEVFGSTHAAILTELLPSSNGGPTFVYDVRVYATDPAGNTTDVLVPDTVQTDAFLSDATFAKESVVEDLTFTLLDRDEQNLVLHAEVMATVAKKRGGPPPVLAPDRAVVASVIVDGVRRDDFVPAGGATFKAHVVRAASAGMEPNALDVDGPFLIGLETDAAGVTFLAFDQPLPSVDSKVTLNVEALVFTSDAAQFQADLIETDQCVSSGGPYDCDTDGDGVPDSCCLDVPVTFAPRGLTTWVMPATKEAARSISDPPDDP